MNFDGLTITIGCPGSGKSTWADANIPATTARLERDRYREALFGSRRAYHDSPLDRSVRSKVITQSMGAAMAMWPVPSWAITDTGLVREAVQPFIDHAWNYWPDRQAVRLVIFERDPAWLRSCNRVREPAHRVPEDLLEDCIEKFFAEDAWWRKDAFEKHYVYRLPAADAA